MSRFSGRQGKGAMRHNKELKREEAEARNKKYQESLQSSEELVDSEK